MADTITIQTSSSTDVVKIIESGPQGPAGSNGANGQGVPVGGTTGQVLRKASGTNYDTEWAAAASGSGSVTSVALAGTGLSISGSPVTTSGTITANVSYGTTAGTAAEGNHTHAASAITSGVLDYARMAHVAQVNLFGDDETLNAGDYATNGNIIAHLRLRPEAADASITVTLPDLTSTSVGEVTLRAIRGGQDLQYAGFFLSVIDDNDALIFPAPPLSNPIEIDADEELTFRWNNGRWDLDLRPNPFATTAVSIFKPNSSGTLALTAQLTDTQVFTANGTWTKPAGAKQVHYVLVAGGSGGGAGRRGATSTTRGGGGGGAGGGLLVGWADASYFSSTESVTVGAGGQGGANAADDTNGGFPTAGGHSQFGSVLRTAAPSIAGRGTDAAAGAGGAASPFTLIVYGVGGSNVSGGGSNLGGNATGGTVSLFLPTGGGGGGSIDSSNNRRNGAIGGEIGNNNMLSKVLGGTAVAGEAGGNGNASPHGFFAGTGGGGGGTPVDGAGTSGGNGGLYGAGGGGGSAALNGAGGSTAGGNGGQGIVVITTYL